VITIAQVGKVVELAATGTNPELNPVAPVVALTRGVQGAPKDDCVAVWFLAMKTNSTTSPVVALMLFGLKARLPEAPTMMVWVAAVPGAVPTLVEVAWAETRETKAARTIEEVNENMVILRDFFL